MAPTVWRDDGSDGIYGGILDSLFELLEAQGFGVVLADAREVSGLPGGRRPMCRIVSGYNACTRTDC